MTETDPIPDEEWATIVKNVPLVSVDLVVTHEGGVVLGRRTNEPAKGEWFVPGGTVLKNEHLVDAVHRIAREELGTTISINSRLGTYGHFYNTSDVNGVDTKHYFATPFIVEPDSKDLAPDDQHAQLQIFYSPFHLRVNVSSYDLEGSGVTMLPRTIRKVINNPPPSTRTPLAVPSHATAIMTPGRAWDRLPVTSVAFSKRCFWLASIHHPQSWL
jgi:colanic acid biosynthesis protein WcaH